MDKFYIIHGLNEFNAAPYGVLICKDGKFTLDVEKAFNRQRRMLNAGCNQVRRLRTCPVEWGAPVKFDYTHPDYFPLLKQYLAICHQPTQLATAPGPGALCIIDPLDGCSEKVSDAEARAILRKFFAEFAGVSYVEFSAGNEMNGQDNERFMRQVVFPEFKAAGRIPWGYGAIYSTGDNYLEKEKQQAEAIWDEPTMLVPFRRVHSVRDSKSGTLVETVAYWSDKKNKIKVEWSCDGVFDGDSTEDFAVNSKDKVQRRPSIAQVSDALRYIFDRMPVPTLGDGTPKYAYEWISKAINRDDLAAKAIVAVSAEYKCKFGAWPANYGKYTLDYVAPVQPEEPVEPAPVVPEKKTKHLGIIVIVAAVVLALLAWAIF